MAQQLNDIRKLWTELYDGNHRGELETFLKDLETFKAAHPLSPLPAEWYRDVVVYSLYVDLFNESFEGLTEKLDYLQPLGVSCLWLLPILDSPMQDAGFDIRNYDKVRSDLVKSKDKTPETVFEEFVKEAHTRGISVIFDVALNHISVEHPWFQAAKDDKTSPYRDYFIWSNTKEKYKEARIIFKGMMESNWTKYGDDYYFHRFFDIQPDLNYRNPKVLREMTMMLMRWLVKGVDGFRADAIPYLWKEEGTNCENLPKTHTIIKIFRAAMDYMRPGGILLAEANQPPREVANYFGDGDECLAAYHFPLMPRMYKALVLADGNAIKDALEPSFTPPIPENCQWFTFLRCHDELTLEMVTPEERKLLYNYYCRNPQWDFRQGEGISARFADLMNSDSRKINLLNAILLTLVGTPVIFYGDEIAKTNDKAFYDETVAKSGYPDSRYLNRGRIDWVKAERDLGNPDSLASRVFYPLQRMMLNRRKYLAFSRGALTFLEVGTDAVLAYQRSLESQTITVIANLSDKEVRLEGILTTPQEMDLLEQPVTYRDNKLVLAPYGFHWFAA
jgi:maltose alpha-D-glucosyltransferase / alpha-amylase